MQLKLEKIFKKQIFKTQKHESKMTKNETKIKMKTENIKANLTY